MESRESERKRKEIIELLSNIKEHFKRLEDYSNIPSLEMNVILSKIAKLQEKSSILKYLMSKKEEKDFDSNNHPHSDGQAEKNEDVSNPQMEESQQKSANEKVEVKENRKTEMPKEIEIPIDVDIAESSTGKGIGKIGDYLDLNAKFSNEDHSLSDQLKKQPISNLLTAIGLNERYLFANHLFNGDMAKFLDEIKKLNSFENENDALEYFDKELSDRDSWKSSEDLVQAFRLLVERRFQG